MEFLAEYGMFLAKLGTIIVILAVMFVLFMQARSAVDEHLDVKSVNRKYEHMQLTLKSAILPKKVFKKALREIKDRLKKDRQKPATAAQRHRIFVINFKGDIRASEVVSLREEVTAILSVVEQSDEVLVKIESGGGTVHGYGLAASQLKRIRDKGISLTVAVDKVAASGGYMMACVADRIIAAPFAIIGSIGVLAQIPNFHRLLKKHNIDFEQISAGKYKRTLTLFGENTDENRAKLQQDIEETHELFKQFVKENRNIVDVDKIATGEHWYGRKAIELNLVDELLTSDDYLSNAVNAADIFEIRYVRKKPFVEKIFTSTARLLHPEEY